MIIRSFPLMLILLKHSHFNLSRFNLKLIKGPVPFAWAPASYFEIVL